MPLPLTISLLQQIANPDWFYQNGSAFLLPAYPGCPGKKAVKRMLKRVLFGAVEGRNYQGRPRKRWVDDILKWCDMTLLQQASHHAQDRVKWKNLIAGPYGS